MKNKARTALLFPHPALVILFFILFVPKNSSAQDEPKADQIKAVIQHEAFTVNALIQVGFRYSLEDDKFQGGRTFEAANARLSFRGLIDNDFYYRVFFNLVREPNLLDAFIGYRHSSALRITAGAMKPKQTQDFIPDPGSTDFIDRTVITGLLVQSRELGVSVEGDIEGLYYFGGLFNGSRLLSNNNNKFYGIGRIQYNIKSILPGSLKIAAQGSYGDSKDIRSGNRGPILRGKRMIYGGDLRLETSRLLLAAEYLAGKLETVELVEKEETISGYYITGGYSILDKTMILARWQSWGYKQKDFIDNQLTLGINHNFTGIASFQLNFDAYLPDAGQEQYGLSAILQVQF